MTLEELKELGHLIDKLNPENHKPYAFYRCINCDTLFMAYFNDFQSYPFSSLINTIKCKDIIIKELIK